MSAFSSDREDLGQLDINELIDSSSVNAGAAASYLARATAEDYADADAVLDLVDKLDKQEQFDESHQPGELVEHAPEQPAAGRRVMFDLEAPIVETKTFRRSWHVDYHDFFCDYVGELKKLSRTVRCELHRAIEDTMSAWVAIYVRSALLTQRLSWIRSTDAELIRAVRRTQFTRYDSRIEIAHHLLSCEFLPPSALSPIVGRPTGDTRLGELHEISDDIALVLDREQIRWSLEERRNRGGIRHDSGFAVYWPSQLDIEHERYFYELRGFLYRVDLAPHTWWTLLTDPAEVGRRGSSYVIGLLWRVVDPATVVTQREAPFPLLLETVLNMWRPLILRDVDHSGSLSSRLRERIAADECWSTIGVEINVQVCEHDGDTVDRIDSDSMQFLRTSLGDRRRWFGPGLIHEAEKPVLERTTECPPGRQDPAVWTDETLAAPRPVVTPTSRRETAAPIRQVR